MCGRYAITTSAERIEKALDAVWEAAGPGTDPSLTRAAFVPRYNLAPMQLAPIVRDVEGAGRVIFMLRWGLVPAWADDPAIGNRLINARAEGASTKPSFRAAWKKRRCLVPVSHFYEWKKEGAGKQPYAIAPAEGEFLALAGLWERWHDELETFTILTTTPNAVMKPLHDRMPVIVPKARWARWLDRTWEGPKGDAEISEWTAPVPAKMLKAFAVSTRVNSPRNDDPACAEPIDLGAGAPQSTGSHHRSTPSTRSPAGSNARKSTPTKPKRSREPGNDGGSLFGSGAE